MPKPLRNIWLATSRARIITAVLLVSFLLWEGAVSLFQIPQFLLPSPRLVLQEIAAAPRWFADAAYYTLLATVLGFLLAVALGVILALLIASSRIMEQTLYTALVALNSIPKVAIAPLLLIWIGSGLESKVVMAAVIAIFPIIVDTALGLRSVDPDTIDLARSLGGRTWGILLKIRLPNALPSLFAGMKVAISFALIGTIVGEFVSSSRGLGYIIVTAQSEFQTARIFAALLILAVSGTVLFVIVDVIERIALPWHVSRRRDEMAPA